MFDSKVCCVVVSVVVWVCGSRRPLDRGLPSKLQAGCGREEGEPSALCNKRGRVQVLQITNTRPIVGGRPPSANDSPSTDGKVL